MSGVLFVVRGREHEEADDKCGDGDTQVAASKSGVGV